MTDSRMHPAPRRARAALATLAALGVALACGCDPNGAITLLTPTGERPQPAIGVISGRLDFGTPGTFPRTLVLVARVKDGAPSSQFNTLQVVGTPTGFNVAASPRLTQLAPSQWIDTLSVPEGPFEWKFVTDGNFDSPPDYGRPGSQADGIVGTAVLGAPGPDGNLVATVSAGDAGLLLCTLDETLSPAPYAFRKIGADEPATFSSTTDGAFVLTGLVPGTYNVQFRAPGSTPVTRTVTLTTAPVDMGTVMLTTGPTTGGITGSLAYDPLIHPDLASPPFPPTKVELFQGGTKITELTTSRSSPTFTFSNLAAGSYVVRADARQFFPDSVNVTVATAVEDVGTITLDANPGELASALHVAGDFNGFTIADSTAMELIALAVWRYPGPSSGQTGKVIAAGTYNFKFVTDAQFDNPTDYGGNESNTIVVPVTNAETSLVSGIGTAIRIQITTAGSYRFTLDERRQTFTIEPAPAPRP